MSTRPNLKIRLPQFHLEVVERMYNKFHQASVAERPVNALACCSGAFVPIQRLLEGDLWFEPEDVAHLAAAFEAALIRLGLADRKDPLTTAVAKAIIQLAKDGERDPKKLCDGALKLLSK